MEQQPQNTIHRLPVDLIDDPVTAMRTKVEDEPLLELAESIRTNGLIQPIVVKRNGERFEVVAGHRRLLAHRHLNETHIDAIIKDYTTEQAESAKVHENLFREDVNPVDQAVFLARYVESTKSTLEDLARMLHRTTDWVAGRLDILKYPDYLIEHVYNGTISLGVAKWLNLIPSEVTKKEYTRFAAIQGINIKTAKRWYELADAGTLPEQPTQELITKYPDGTEEKVPVIPCILCGGFNEISMLVTDFVHPDCRQEYLQELIKQQQNDTQNLPERVEATDNTVSRL